MSDETVLFEARKHVALITLNRPQALNAVNPQLWSELAVMLRRFAGADELWVAIITAAGDKAFCVGADLKEAARGFQIPEDAAELGFAGIVRHFVPKPIIAAVNGLALGGGMEIALACDLIVASELAQFGLPEVKRGLVAGAGGLLRLPRQIPLKRALEAAFTGDPLSAQEALQWGLVNRVVAPQQLLTEALALANKICQNAPIAVRTSKEIIYRGLDATVDFPPTAWDMLNELAARNRATADAHEGPRAFAEKREPKWQGR